MIRPAILRRRMRRTAVAVAVALSAVACSTGPGPSNSPSSARVTPARLTHALPDDPVRMLFPATGAESRWTQGLSVFGQQVAGAVEASCARDGGIAPPERGPLTFIRVSAIPDLDFLGRHGFAHGAELPAPEARSTPTGSGSPAVVRRCRAEGGAAARAVHDAYATLQRRWFSEVTSVRRDPVTVRALEALPECLAGQGFRVSDEDDFFGLVDSRLLTASTADFPRVDRELGHAYATCMRPVEAAREPARLRLRTRFIAQHVDEVRELRETFVASLRRAEKEYGVRLTFPAP